MYFWHNFCIYSCKINFREIFIMALSMFMPSTTGMTAQSHALETVGTNIANINTVGYKSSETMFYTLLGANPVVKGSQDGISSSRVDIHGVGYYDRTNVTQQGQVTASNNNYDVAINGTGNAFFTLKDRYSGDVYYTRAGDFKTMSTNGSLYLVNNNGLRVQGFPALEGGGFGGSPSDIVINYPEKIPSTPTTKASITANVPASGADTSSYGITIYGPNNDGETMNMLFTKVDGKVNTWNVTFDVNGGTVTTAEPIEAVFSPDGKLLSPKDFTVNVAWDDGSTNTIAMNIENMTQYDGSSGITDVKQDGKESGDFKFSAIGEEGIVYASYSNGQTVNIAKLALTGFSAPDNLTSVSGTLFEANGLTGDSYYLDSNKDFIKSQALERSTANVETEFTNMVVVQRAYGLNSSAFTASNEMLQLIVNLKT